MPFQKEVNKAAIELGLANPVLITKGSCGELLDKARPKVSDGYNFK